MADIIQFPNAPTGDMRSSERLRMLISGEAVAAPGACANPGLPLNDQGAAIGSPDEWAQSACFHLSCSIVGGGGVATVSKSALWFVLGYVERLEIETGRIPAPPVLA